MIIFDVILLLILAGFVFYGLFFGLIRTAGALAGVIIGAWAANYWYLEVFSWIQNLFFGHNNLGKIITFIILFSLINRLVCFAFAVLDKTFSLLSIIPFLKTFNRLAGAILGFVLGGLLLGLILYVISNYAIIGIFINKWMVDSQVAPFLIKFINMLKPLLPEMLQFITHNS